MSALRHYTLEEVLTPLTVAEIETSVYTVLGILGVKTTGWKVGGVARAIVSAFARVLAAFTVLTTSIAKMGWLEFAVGAWLTFTARYDYGVIRRAATFAEGSITLNNGGGGVYSFAAGDLVVLNSTTNKTYTNTAPVAVAALQTNVVANVRAVQAGADSTAAPGQIDDFETTYLGLTVTNPLALVGLDEENDTELKIRCGEAAVAASPLGPRDAYSFFAKKATRLDGTKIGITRVRATVDSDTGDVAVTVATAAGALSPEDIDDAEIYLYRHAAPLGVTLTVLNGAPLVIPVTYEAWYTTATGVTDAQVAEAVARSLTAFFASRPIGGEVIPPSAVGHVYVSGLRAAIVGARPEIFHAVVSSPAVDVACAVNSIPTLGAITPTPTPVTS